MKWGQRYRKRLKDAARVFKHGLPPVPQIPAVPFESYSEHLNFQQNQTVFAVVMVADNELLHELSSAAAADMYAAEAWQRTRRVVQKLYKDREARHA